MTDESKATAPVRRNTARGTRAGSGGWAALKRTIAFSVVRPKVLAYQRECFRVLSDACLGRARGVDIDMAPEILLPAPIGLSDPRVCLRPVTECRPTFGPQPARELWFHLGPSRVPGMARMPLVALFAHAESRPGGQA